jgi:hypothetical protein
VDSRLDFTNLWASDRHTKQRGNLAASKKVVRRSRLKVFDLGGGTARRQKVHIRLNFAD